MNKAKKIISAIAVLSSVATFAQTSAFTSHYPAMYENQAAAISAASADRATLGSKEQIDVNINSLLTDPVLRNASWGFVIYDPKTNKIINSYNENLPLVPASTTKLLTTDTAMSLLGPKFRWTTQLDYSGSIDSDGTLNGNLYVVGSGDPSLGTGKAGAESYTNIIYDYISAASELGIKKVTGDIIVETAVFANNKKDLPKNIVWREQGSYYLPAGNTQNINPQNEQVTVNQSNPFSKEARYFYISPYSSKMVFASKYDGGAYLNTNLPDAPVYLANSLRASLIKNGISVSGKVVPRTVEANPEQREKIFSYQSPDLAEIITFTNKNSDNALAEALLRTVGFQKDGDQTLDSGRRVVTEHLTNEGFDVSNLNYVDGSGLSRSHRVTPIAQAKFLAHLMNQPYYKDYFNSLPVGGQDGTLKKMFFGDAYGQIFAKTGTLNKVKCLAGYIKTRNGKTLTFSLLVNDYAGSVDGVKSRMEQLLNPAVNL